MEAGNIYYITGLCDTLQWEVRDQADNDPWCCFCGGLVEAENCFVVSPTGSPVSFLLFCSLECAEKEMEPR